MVKNTSIQPVSPSYYLTRVAKSFDFKENGYLVALTRQHFTQTVEALRIGKSMKLPPPARELKLPKKNPKLKTVYLDLDETLIHCDELSNNYTVKLDFPVEGGSTVSVLFDLQRQASEYVLSATTSYENCQQLQK